MFKTLPDRGNEKEYEKAVTALNKHYTVCPNATFMRHKLRKLIQEKGETIAKFVSRLTLSSEG